MDDEALRTEFFGILDSQPQLRSIYSSDQVFGEAAVRSFVTARQAGKSKAELLSFLVSLAEKYRVDRDGVLNEMYAHYMSFASPTPLLDFIQNRLDASEDVYHLKPGSFDAFLGMSDEALAKFFRGFVAYQFGVQAPDLKRNREELVSAYIERVEFLISWHVQGRMVLDDRSGEVYMYNPIGEILDEEMIGDLKAFLERKRLLTEQEILEMLDVFDVDMVKRGKNNPPANYVWPRFFEEFLNQNEAQFRWVIRIVIFHLGEAINDVAFRDPPAKTDEPLFKVILNGLRDVAIGKYKINKKTGDVAVCTPVGESPNPSTRASIDEKIEDLRPIMKDELLKILLSQKDKGPGG